MPAHLFSRVVVGLVVIASAWAVPAQAQTFGLRAGATGSPDQFYFGVHADTPPIADRVSFRPNVEVGIGDDVTLLTFNLEFVFRHALPSSSWTVMAGGGPAANFYSFAERRGRGSDLGGGLNLLLGIEHQDGLFGEVKVGLIDSPSVKFGVGFSFGR